MKNRFLTFTTTIFLLLSAAMSHSRTIEVSHDGLVSTIAAAIKIAKQYDTIKVSSGVYQECELKIKIPMTIQGVEFPTIDADGKGMIFVVNSKNVNISGIRFVNTPVSFIKENAAVLLENTSDCKVTNNKFQNNFFAVFAANSERCEILDNEIVGNATSVTSAGNGIHLWYCQNFIIAGNEVRGQRDGIYFEFVRNSSVKDNYVEKNLRYGLHFMFSDTCLYESNSFIGNKAGVAVMYTRQVEMKNNLFKDSWGGAAYGLLLKDIKDCQIVENKFVRNSIAIRLDGSDRINVEKNEIIDNGWALKIMANCQDNVIKDNDFVNNSFQVATNSRSSSSVFSGNYWSSYRGYDLDRDGFGDVAYRPVSLYSLLVESNPPTLVLLHSLVIDALNLAERIIPTLTPETLVDSKPRMSPNL